MRQAKVFRLQAHEAQTCGFLRPLTLPRHSASVEVRWPVAAAEESVPRIEIESDLAELPRVTGFIENFIEDQELSPKTGMHLNLVLEELVTNVIQHGYGGTSGPIRLTLEREGDLVAAEIRDQAPPFDPFSAPTPDLALPIEERVPGGLGVHLVREIADSVAYEREGNENRVSLSMRI